MDAFRNSVSQGPGRAIFMILMFILIVLAIYYLYNWLYGNSEMKDYVLYSSSNTGLVATTPKTLSAPNVPPIYTGGECSVSTWIYVKGWNTNSNKPFLTLSGGGTQYNTMVMYLGKNINKLGIRVTTAKGDGVNNGILPGVSPNKFQSSEQQLVSITQNIPTSPYDDNTFAQCDIESVDLQRWVNITTVISGKTVDVYIDGKLSRSNVLPGIIEVDGDGTATKVKLGDVKAFDGYIGRTRVANFAYSPDLVYRYYQYGPFTGAFSLMNLNFSSWSFDIKQDGVSIFEPSTR